MASYKEISAQDFEEAEFSMKHGRYRPAVYYFQQFAEKGAKSLLEKRDPSHKAMRSHIAEDILAAYDEEHKVSDISDKARYLTGFYFNTRYPGDNYMEVSEAQAKKAYKFAIELRKYFEAEMTKLEEEVDSVKIEL